MSVAEKAATRWARSQAFALTDFPYNIMIFQSGRQLTTLYHPGFEMSVSRAVCNPAKILRYDVHAAGRAGDRHLLGVFVHLSTHQLNSDWM